MPTQRITGQTQIAPPVPHQHKYTILYPAHALGNTVPPTGTYYNCPFVDGAAISTERQMVILQAGTVKNLYIRGAGTQPASGSLVVTVRKGGDTTLTVTIPAGGGVANYSDLIHSFSVVPGDFIGFQLKNNATAVSIPIGFMAVELEVTVDVA